MSAVLKLDDFRSRDVQPEGKKRMQDGFVAIPNTVDDTLLCSPLTRHQERVFRAIFRKTGGFGKQTDCIANSQIAVMTNIDESDIRKAIRSLVDFGMLIQGRRTANGTFLTPVLDVEKWDISAKTQTREITTNITPNGGNHPGHSGEITPHNRHSQQTETPNTFANAQVSSSAGADGQSAENGEPATADKPKVRQSINPQVLVDLYHEHCPSLPRIKLLTDSRKQALRSRWKQAGVELGRYGPQDVQAGLEWWAAFFQVVEASDFLSGRTNSHRGEKVFKAGFDWLMKQLNFAKVIEGNYDNEVGQ